MIFKQCEEATEVINKIQLRKEGKTTIKVRIVFLWFHDDMNMLRSTMQIC